MSENTRSLLRSLAAGAIIAGLAFWNGASQDHGFLRCLCDALFVAAVMLLGLGGIRAVSNKGVFDVAGYGLKSTVETFFPFLSSGEKEDVMQYRERKAAERKSPRGLLLAGAGYLALSVAVLIVYELFGR